MRIESAVYSDGNLMLKCSDPAARRFAYEFTVGDYEIVKAKKRRSLDANAYAWVLIDSIAASVSLPKIEVYRNAIKSIGGVSDIVCVKEEAVAGFCEKWQANGIGWQTETMPSKLEGCRNVILYYGSSSYDVRQMSLLIDSLISDAKALGIEVLPPERIEGLLSEWG